MSYLSLAQAQAWLESTKLSVASIDSDMEATLAAQLFAALGTQYDTTTWADSASTPSLVLDILAMQYAAWYYDKAYSQDDAGNGNSYADRLRLRADTLVAGILDGTLAIGADATPLDVNISAPDFFPNDASSNPSTAYAGLSKSSFGYLGDGVPGVDYDTSDGGPAFSMGSRW